MISGKFDDKAVKRLEKKLGKLAQELEFAQVSTVRTATLLVHETAVKSLQDNSDGQLVLRYNPKRQVHASDPGDPPNTDTGRAVQSIKFEFENKGLTGSVGTNLKYLAWLEFGTSSIEPRPWLSAALAKVSKEVAKMFVDATKDVIAKIEKLGG